MDVFVIPIARDRYELYCEPSGEVDSAAEGIPATGLFGRLRYRFGVMLRAVEERHRHEAAPADRSWLGQLTDTALGWVAERIAEQRLLWNLRRQTSAVAVHPPDMTFDQVLTLIKRTLQRDYDRHRVWLVVDAIGLVALRPARPRSWPKRGRVLLCFPRRGPLAFNAWRGPGAAARVVVGTSVSAAGGTARRDPHGIGSSRRARSRHRVTFAPAAPEELRRARRRATRIAAASAHRPVRIAPCAQSAPVVDSLHTS